ncbi:MAG: phosphoribosyltransferase [Phycisphaerae bacterium]|nr:phosphoribosyltransferase [Phycisphaerae bacterium]
MGAKHVISRNSEIFTDRADAAERLAEVLQEFKSEHPVILGIPRGGVVVADHLARSLDGDLDIVLAHKLGAPANRELAIGAVCEDGTAFVDERIARAVAASEQYIEREKHAQLQLMQQRVARYREILCKTDLRDRVVIVTDDGVATGATMKAALWAVRQEEPQRTVAALPVGPSNTIEELAETADEVICLETPPYFAAIGQFYRRFEQVDDSELLAILQHEHERRCRV